MLVYIAISVLILAGIGYWKSYMLKETIFWSLGSALVALFSIKPATPISNYYIKTILDNLKMVAVLEYIINLYTFSLLTEMLLVPLTSFAVIISVYTESKPEYYQVNKFIKIMLALYGIAILALTIHNIAIDAQNAMTIKNLFAFMLPLILTIMLLPYIYAIALYMMYESFFLRIRMANKDPDLIRYAKREIIKKCNINLSKLLRVSRKAAYPKISNKQDISNWFGRTKQ